MERKLALHPNRKAADCSITISGSGVKFSSIINNCICRCFPDLTCDEHIVQSIGIFDNLEFRYTSPLPMPKLSRLVEKWRTLIHPKVPSYIIFSNKQWLTTKCRKRSNDINDQI